MQYDVEQIPQRTERTCWEACARMMWNWRYRNDLATQTYYESKIGEFLQVDQGLDDRGLFVFYKLLKLRALKPAHGYNIRFALKWTPVIISFAGSSTHSGHIVVVAGFNGRQYKIVDPQGAINMDPAAGNKWWNAATYLEDMSSLDRHLGPQMFYW